MIPTKDPAFHFNNNTTEKSSSSTRRKRNHLQQQQQQQEENIEKKTTIENNQNDDDEEDIDLTLDKFVFSNGLPFPSTSSSARFYPVDPVLQWSAFSKLRRSYWTGENKNKEEDDEFSDDDSENENENENENEQQQENEDDTTPLLSSSPSSPSSTNDSLLTPSQQEQVTKLISKIKNEKDVQKRSFWFNLSLPAVSKGILEKYCPQLKKSSSCYYQTVERKDENEETTATKTPDPFTNLASFLDEEFERVVLSPSPSPSTTKTQQQQQNKETIQKERKFEGATLQILAVITGNTPLLQLCLESGLCNPNDQRFLMDLNGESTAELLRVGDSKLPASSNSNKDGIDNEDEATRKEKEKKEAEDRLKNPILPKPTTTNPQQVNQNNQQQQRVPHLSTVRNGYTPFFMACICEQLACMEMLYHHGASLHVTDRWGRTPLHAAAAMGNKSVVDWLLAHGAPRLVVDRDGYRPGALRFGCPGVNNNNQNNNNSQRQLLIPPRDPRFSHILMRPSLNNNNNQKSSSSTTTSPTNASQQQQQKAQPLPCPCGSGRVCGSCGCIDDSHEKWFTDRASSRWISGDIINAMSEAQSSVLSLCLPNFIFGSYYQQQKASTKQENDTKTDSTK